MTPRNIPFLVATAFAAALCVNAQTAATTGTAAAPAAPATPAAPAATSAPARPELAPPPIITKSPPAANSTAGSTTTATSGTGSSPILLGAPLIKAADLPPATPALVPAGNPNERIPDFNWPAMPISMAIPEIEKLTGRTVIRPATLANVPDLTLKFGTPPTRAEALQAVETLLAVNQLALIPLGDKLLKLVPLSTARMEAPTFIEGSVLSLPPSGRIATKLFQLEFLRAGEFAQQLPSMLNDQVRTFSYFERSNAILITDAITTLQRIEILLKHVDRPAATPVQAKFYSLEYSTASDLVNKFKTIFQGPLAQQLGASTTFNADDRTNQVFVIGDPRQFPFFDDLIKKLDVKSDPNTRNEVIRLRTALAQDVASILGTVISGQIRAAQAAQNASAAAQRQFGAPGAAGTANRYGTPGGSSRYGTPGGSSGSPGGNTSSRYGTPSGGSTSSRSSGTPSSGSSRYSSQAGNTGGNSSRGSSGGPSGAQGGGTSNRGATGGGTGRPMLGGSITPAFAAGGGGGFSGAALGLTDADQFSNYITVTPDQRTNSIVVSGTVDDIRIIKDLIEKLDILLSQVRIEVVIAEVSLTDAASSGIDSLGLQILGNKLVGFNSAAAGVNIGGATGGTGLATIDRIASRYSLSGFIGLITTPRKNNIASVSKQDLTTMHNQKASFFFGETRPVITASTYNDVSGSQTSSVTQLEIGTTLTVTPLIGYDGSVQLTLVLDVSDVTGNVTLDQNTQYIIGKRNTNSTIIAKSGDIIVLGGIQKNSSIKASNRLGPIPIIGDLLGARNRSKTHNELIFFLRPVVLTNTPADNAPAFKQLDEMDVIKDDVNKALDKQPAPAAAQPAPAIIKKKG